jgi:hypothetical protein
MKTIEIESLPDKTGQYLVRFRGIEIPLSYKPGSTQSLIIIFHGAVNQYIRKMPFFQDHFPSISSAHQISISDASLTKNINLQAGWYAGSQDIPLQDLLSNFFKEIQHILSINKTIYFGASAGGFAALFYSHFDKDSLAIAVNPQINLNRWLNSSITNYRESCWPDLKTNTDLNTVITMNIADIYSESMVNFVCLINSSGDRFHLFTQTLELMSRLSPAARDRFVLSCDFHGILGHSGSIPYSSCTPWLTASLAAKDFRPDSILASYHKLRKGSEPGLSALVKKPVAGFEPTAEDLAIADSIKKWQLHQSN